MRRIDTERLVLRPRERTDDPELHRILMDAVVMERVFAGGALASPEACEQFIHDHFAQDGEEPIGIGTLALRSDGRVIGFAGLIPCDADGYEGDVEFGVVLAAPDQREGCATEISRAMIDLAPGELGCPRVLALTHPGNSGGRGVLDRLGLQFIEEVPAGDREIRRVYSRSRIDRAVCARVRSALPGLMFNVIPNPQNEWASHRVSRVTRVCLVHRAKLC